MWDSLWSFSSQGLTTSLGSTFQTVLQMPLLVLCTLTFKNPYPLAPAKLPAHSPSPPDPGSGHTTADSPLSVLGLLCFYLKCPCFHFYLLRSHSMLKTCAHHTSCVRLSVSLLFLHGSLVLSPTSLSLSFYMTISEASPQCQALL